MSRIGLPSLLVAVVLLPIVLAPTAASANWIAGIACDHPSPTYLSHSETVVVSIDYRIDEAEGALVHVTPFAGGVEATNVVLGPSPLVPTGEGSVARSFGISAGTQTIDEVRVRMNNAANTLVLLEFFLPVEFFYGPYGIFDIQIDKSDYSVLARNEPLNVDFKVGMPGGETVLVFARPHFDGSSVPGYSAGGGGAPLGYRRQSFWFSSPPKDINQIYFKMTNDDQSVVLLEFHLPAHYFWRPIGVSNLDFSVQSPSSVHTSHSVTVSFDYLSNIGGGGDALYSVQPYYNGSYAANGTHQAGGVVNAAWSSTSRTFGATGDASVNQVRLLVTNPDETYTFMDVLIPVQYEFSSNAVYNVTTYPEPPMQIDYTQNLTMNFDYKKDNPATVLIITLPAKDGLPVVNFASTGSWPYSAPEGSETYGYRLDATSSFKNINQLHVKMFVQGGGEVLEDYYMDVINYWGPSGIATPAPKAHGVQSSLEQNTPNPFNPRTAIFFSVGQETRATLRVYDAAGRLVDTLLNNDVVQEGRNSVIWDGMDKDGRSVSTGVYFYRLDTGETRETKRMLLVK